MFNFKIYRLASLFSIVEIVHYEDLNKLLKFIYIEPMINAASVTLIILVNILFSKQIFPTLEMYPYAFNI